MDWTKLHTSYHDDGKVVALRTLHGFAGEVFWTRMIAGVGKVQGPIVVPASAEFAVLTEILGFPPADLDMVERIATDAAEFELVTRRERGKSVQWDTRARSKWQPPRSTTPEYKREQKRRERAQSVAEMSPRHSNDVAATSPPRSRSREEEETNPPSPPLDPVAATAPPNLDSDDGAMAMIAKYLGKLRNSQARTWAAVSQASLIEIGAESGMGIRDVAEELGFVWEWWQTAGASKRWKNGTRGWRTWVKNERHRRIERQQQATLEQPAAPAAPAGPTPHDKPEDVDEANRLAELNRRVAEKLGIPLNDVDDEAYMLYAEIRRGEIGLGPSTSPRAMTAGIGKEVP